MQKQYQYEIDMYIIYVYHICIYFILVLSTRCGQKLVPARTFAGLGALILVHAHIISICYIIVYYHTYGFECSKQISLPKLKYDT